MITLPDIVDAFAIGYISGAVIVASIVQAYWKTNAVKRGFAEYDAKTGEWRWKETAP